MNQKKKIENYQQIAMGTGLRYDEVGGLFHGERDGFDFIVYAPDARYPYMMVPVSYTHLTLPTIRLV